jgi:hypothetical protein
MQVLNKEIAGKSRQRCATPDGEAGKRREKRGEELHGPPLLSPLFSL